jgi:hypothetical protein
MIVVSDAFNGKPLLQSHRMDNETLKSKLKGDVHALSIQNKIPALWDENAKIRALPSCLDGMLHDKKGSSSAS